MSIVQDKKEIFYLCKSEIHFTVLQECVCAAFIACKKIYLYKKQYRNGEKMKEFFEGWYLKHQIEDKVICFIPSFHFDKKGNVKGTLQVVMKDGAGQKIYEKNECGRKKDKFSIKMGDNLFTEQGIQIFFQTEEISVQGKLKYEKWTALKSDIMGCFQYLPCLQCRHGILSMYHKLKGSLLINGEKIDFTNGVGYIEKDCGTSFPKSYFWTQCNEIEGKIENSIFTSVADVPLYGKSIIGCISAIFYEGKEYRFATYLGAKVLKYSENEVILMQGKNILHIQILEKKGQILMTPKKGMMSGLVRECLSSKVRYQFWMNKKLVFDYISTQAGVEYKKEPSL